MFLDRRSEEVLAAQVHAADKRISKLGLPWPENYLHSEREEAGER